MSSGETFVNPETLLTYSNRVVLNHDAEHTVGNTIYNTENLYCTIIIFRKPRSGRITLITNPLQFIIKLCTVTTSSPTVLGV